MSDDMSGENPPPAHISGSSKSSSKDKHRDKDRDHKSSSSSSRKRSSRDKEKPSSSSSSSSKDKHRDKDRDDPYRDKDRERSDKDKHNSSSSSSSSHKSSSKDKERREDDESPEEDYKPEEEEEDDDEDMPLAMFKTKSRQTPQEQQMDEEDDEEDIPLAKRKTKAEDVKPKKKVKKKHHSATVKTETASTSKGVMWNTLEHKGPVFAPPYERLPKNVRFFYDGKPMHLSEETEECATFYAKMLNHEFCTKQIFNDNFFKDFRRTMNEKETKIIKDFNKCNFEEMHQYFLTELKKRKNATKEEKLAKKMENEALIKEYDTCIIDGHKEKIRNFRLEPPGLFRGRGEHPKMGMIKRRIRAEDVSINCGKESKIPPPPPGHRWKEVLHNNTVTWLASWVENVQGQVKYIILDPSSKLKGKQDQVKYETARQLAKSIDKIRESYRNEWESKEMLVRQRAVALYFIDKLSLRAGKEKDEDQADTVGCCSLRVEHVQLHKSLNGKENVVVFDFLGKDSIRYYNEVEVGKCVFKNLELFIKNKKTGDDLFDRLNARILNEHLKEWMEGLTAKVFRTYNASNTLQNQLAELTEDDMTLPEKLLAYKRANRAVAILCNHRRSVPKSHEKFSKLHNTKMKSVLATKNKNKHVKLLNLI